MSDHSPSRSSIPVPRDASAVESGEAAVESSESSGSTRSFVPSSPPASAPLSQLPPRESAHRLAARLLTPEDLKFLERLRQAGLIRDLDEDELLRVATSIPDADGLERRIDLLEAYYGGGGDVTLARARARQDRFLLQRASEPVTTTVLLSHLADVAPELGELVLEQIGTGDDGPLVLRAGEHIAALVDDDEELLDPDQIDLTDLEIPEGAIATITLRGLVRAVNVLLDRHGVRDRMVALRSDAEREVYLATTVTEALELAQSGWLEDDDVEDVMELASW